MRHHNMKFYGFLISLFYILFLNTCTAKAESELDLYLRQKTIGTWKYNEGLFNTETTYFSDGTFEGKGIINLPDNKLPMFVKGNWLVDDGYLIEIIVETNMPEEFLPYNNESIDKIESVSEDRLIRIDEEGERWVYVRMQAKDDSIDTFDEAENIETLASAFTMPEEAQSFIVETEKLLKLQETIQRIEKGKISPRKLQTIYLILQNTPEYFIHNLNGVSGNQVFMHEDGYSEAVFGKDGEPVKDGINDASYNYYDRRKEPLKHFSFDTHPWLMLGNSRKDTTSQGERISGYIGDLETGIRKSLESKDVLEGLKKDKWDRSGQLQALAIFILALQKANSDSLYTLFEKDTSLITDQEITITLKDLELGLNKAYSESIVVADEIVLDGSSPSSLELSLSRMASGLNEQQQMELLEALTKIILNVDVGDVLSEEEALEKSQKEEAKILDGKTFQDIISMASKLQGNKQAEQAREFDVQRVKDVHQIARLVEEFYEKTRYYPLANKSFKLPIVVPITNKKYNFPGQPVSFEKFYYELKQVLGDDVKIPFDPDQKDTKSARLYQYYTDTVSYEVSAFLYSRNKFTTELSQYSHKYQIGSIPGLRRKVYRLQDIDYINKHGFDNPEDQQKLIDAVKNNKIEVVKKLIKKGVNLSPICGFNHKGQPLVYAVQAQNIEMIKLLISKGADVNGRNAYYDTPLIYALEIFKNINTEIFKMLLEADADVNQPNAFGFSPFIGACACGDLDLVKLMYKYGGDVQKNYVSLTSQNTFQKTVTPLQAAENGEHKHIVKFLKEQGAN